MNKLAVTATFALGAAAVPLGVQQATTKDQLIGSWKVLNLKATTGDRVAFPLGERVAGYVTITPTRCWLLFVDATRKAPAAPALTDAEAVAMMRTQVAWTGKYTTAEHTPEGIKLTARVDAASSQAIFDTDLFDGSTFAIYGLLVLIAPIVVVNRILRHTEVKLPTILGAVCAYLLIGMFFGFVYGLIDRIDSGPFFDGRAVVDQFDYLYFSYASLTTAGFGDFVARGDLGRGLSVLEAVLGQIFLVPLVARLVGIFGQRRDTPS